MNADFAILGEWRELDFRCPDFQSSLEHREGEIPGVHIFRHSPINDPRVRIARDVWLAFTPLFGPEQLLYWSFCLFAHHSSKKSPLVPTDLIRRPMPESVSSR